VCVVLWLASVACLRGVRWFVRWFLQAGPPLTHLLISSSPPPPLALSLTHQVRWLIGRGADVGARDDKGLSALHYAAMKDRSEVAQALLAAGADPMTRDDTEFGYTPVHVCVHYDARATLAVLLAQESVKAGVNVECVPACLPACLPALGG
jgi:ankyrin repeat protein